MLSFRGSESQLGNPWSTRVLPNEAVPRCKDGRWILLRALGKQSLQKYILDQTPHQQSENGFSSLHLLLITRKPQLQPPKIFTNFSSRNSFFPWCLDCTRMTIQEIHLWSKKNPTKILINPRFGLFSWCYFLRFKLWSLLVGGGYVQCIHIYIYIYT